MMFPGCVMFRSTTLHMVDRVAYLSLPPLHAPTTRLTFLSPSSPFLFQLKPTSLFTSSSSFFALTSPPRSTMLHHDPLVSDIYATAISAIVALSGLRFWQETAKRGIFDQVGRKIVFFVLGRFKLKKMMLGFGILGQFSVDVWKSLFLQCYIVLVECFAWF